MVFGKIEYLNLLPFHIFMKRYSKTLRHHATIEYKKGVPSKINKEFKYRRVDAAFISTAVVKRRKSKRSILGIVAKKEVLSVLVIPAKEASKDSASATSNLLAEILKIEGKVIIGDNALRYYLQELSKSSHNFVDLAQEWERKYRTPFTFALLSANKKEKAVKKLSKIFLKTKIYIPQYLLHDASIKSGISKNDILHYLQYISYEMNEKSIRGVAKFKALSQYKHI